MVGLVYYIINLLFLGILLLYDYINLRSSIIFFFFLRYISFFRYFYIKFCIFCFTFNCFWTIMWWSSRDICNFISNFITSQITSCSCCFLNCSFWSSFTCICSRFFGMIKKFRVIFTSYVFYLCFCQKFCS